MIATCLIALTGMALLGAFSYYQHRKIKLLKIELLTLSDYKKHASQLAEFHKLYKDVAALGAGMIEIRRIDPDDVFLRGEL